MPEKQLQVFKPCQSSCHKQAGDRRDSSCAADHSVCDSLSVLMSPAAASFAGGAKLGPKEQAYVAVVKQLNQAAAQHTPMDPIAAFGSACEQYEDKTPDTLMSTCWKLLGDILSVARARGLTSGHEDYVDALLQVHLQLTNQSSADSHGQTQQVAAAQTT